MTTCGAAELIAALQLALTLVGPIPDPLAVGPNISHPICGCECLQNQAAALRCRADRLEEQSRQIQRHNEQVEAFRAAAKACGVEGPSTAP